MLTKTERVILENTKETCKYIARDGTGELFVYETKPKKSMDFWYEDDDDGLAFELAVFSHLFQSIKWEDEEPYKFR